MKKENNSFSECFTAVVEKELVGDSPFVDNQWSVLLDYFDKGTIEFLKTVLTFSFDEAVIMEAKSVDELQKICTQAQKAIFNLAKVNEIVSLDEVFKTINKKLTKGGFYVGWLQKKANARFNFLNLLGRWSIIVFFIAQDMPKYIVANTSIKSKECSKIRKISKAEAFGRLYSCGFKIIDEKQVANDLVFISKKVSSPILIENPTKGVIAKLLRVGRNGKTIKVYKLRTMYPYSEFIQDYVYKKNGSLDGDKATNDFRVTKWGRIMRKYWIDEVPMIINLIRGDIKLIGVRPLSKSKFNMYPKWLQEKRIKSKPGLIPPFYADLPESFGGLLESESKYLDQYFKAPLKTDIKYFFKILYNIIIKGARSK